MQSTESFFYASNPPQTYQSFNGYCKILQVGRKKISGMINMFSLQFLGKYTSCFQLIFGPCRVR